MGSYMQELAITEDRGVRTLVQVEHECDITVHMMGP